MAAKKDDKKEDKKTDVDASLDEGTEGAAPEGGDPLAEGDGTPSKFGKKKIIIFIAAPLLLLIAAGAGLYFTGMLDKFIKKDEVAAEGAAAGEHGAPAVDAHGNPIPSGPAFLKIPDMIVNLSGTEAQPRYLRLAVQLELKNPSDKEAVEAVMPRVVDQFQTYLRELRVKDLKGSAGIYRLQMELLSRVNAAAHPVEVKDVLFQEILIQ